MTSVSFIIAVFILFKSNKGFEVTLLDTSQSDSLRWTTYHGDPDKRGWREASYASSDGEVLRVYTVCLVASTTANNWLRTPFIKRREANRIFIQVKFTMRKCTKYPEPNKLQQCKESFRILQHQSDRDYGPDHLPQWDEMSYKMVDVIPANKVFTDNSDALINIETRSIPVMKRGVYFAFQDQGACATLLAVRVYYVACPEVIQSLAYFEETAAGKDLTSIVQRSGKCVKDAVEGHREPSYLCKGDGKWNFYSGDCLCRSGYQPDENNTQCIACSPGRFKYEKGNSLCDLCPLNSMSWGVASVICQCSEGYYRSDPHSKCRSPPSRPRDLMIQNISQSSVELVWSRPEVTGDSHVWYTMECKSCDQNVVYIPRQFEINNTRVLVTNLKPSTEYLMSVYSENSITHLSDVIRLSADVIVETDDAVPPKVTNLHVTSIGSKHISLSWDAPAEVEVYFFEIFMRAKQTGNDVTPIFHHHHHQHQSANQNSDGDDVDVSERSIGYYNYNNNDSDINEMGTILIKLNMTGKKNHGIKNFLRADQRIKNENVNFTGVAMITTTKYNNATFTSLQPHTEYYFQVRIKTKKYVGEFGAPISATTGIILHHPVETPLALLVASSVGLLLCTSVGALVVLLISRRNRQLLGNKLNCDLSKNTFAMETMQACDGVYPVYSHTSSVRTYVDPYTYEDPNMAISEFAKEIDAIFITIESVIGGGEFGDVCKGVLSLSSKPSLVVAIKTLKSGASEKNRLDFLTEASIMGQFDHPNVIYLEGVVTKSNPVMIVTEFMMNGSLDIFLRNKDGQFTMLQLVGMMRGVASGMKYLAEMGYVHRDLAARNILVSETLICKVSDFGLSREIELDTNNGEYTTKGGKIPIRWTAPEAIAYRKFTTSSDVWSYGVVVWEIVTYGERPYWDWSNGEVIKAIEGDFTLPPPVDCPDTIHTLMLDCWQKDRLCRPKFSEIVKTLDKLIRSPEHLLHIAQSSSAEMTSFQSDIMTMMTKDYETVDEFLKRIKMERYLELFRNSGIDNIEKVAMLNLRDLITMGIHLIGHQKKFLDNVHALRCHF